MVSPKEKLIIWIGSPKWQIPDSILRGRYMLSRPVITMLWLVEGAMALNNMTAGHPDCIGR